MRRPEEQSAADRPALHGVTAQFPGVYDTLYRKELLGVQGRRYCHRCNQNEKTETHNPDPAKLAIIFVAKNAYLVCRF
jgi:hypothetical protein